MKFAGKAFVAGFAGWLGAATAIGVTIGVAGVLVEKKLKRMVGEFETYLKEQTDDMIGKER